MANTYTLIEAKTLGVATASITFTAIPQTYTDLKLVISGRSNLSSKSTNCSIQIGNSTVDTGSNYTYLELTGNGSAVFMGTATTDKFNTVMNAATSSSDTFSNVEVYIPNYTSSAQKSLSVDAVIEDNSGGGAIQVRLQTWIWSGTSAINIITLFPGSGDFIANSNFYLYGIKNS